MFGVFLVYFAFVGFFLVGGGGVFGRGFFSPHIQIINREWN